MKNSKQSRIRSRILLFSSLLFIDFFDSNHLEANHKSKFKCMSVTKFNSVKCPCYTNPQPKAQNHWKTISQRNDSNFIGSEQMEQSEWTATINRKECAKWESKWDKDTSNCDKWANELWNPKHFKVWKLDMAYAYIRQTQRWWPIPSFEMLLPLGIWK